MSYRKVVSKHFSDLLKVLAHPHRLRIVEEIGAGELDVNSLQERLDINQTGVSQHLAVLRAHKIVQERREGRSVFYHLQQPELAAWLLDGLKFLTEEESAAAAIRLAVDDARAAWTIESKR